jgi:hypothetical protein
MRYWHHNVEEAGERVLVVAEAVTCYMCRLTLGCSYESGVKGNVS